MSGSNSAERKRYEPLVLVETADLSEKTGWITGAVESAASDVSAIFGYSPFRTARDLYYDKLNIASVEDDEGNVGCHGNGAFAGASGSKIFERKTGYRVYQIKRCSSTHSILGCWLMWTTLWNCRMAPQRSLRSRPQTIMPEITGG